MRTEYIKCDYCKKEIPENDVYETRLKNKVKIKIEWYTRGWFEDMDVCSKECLLKIMSDLV